MLHQNLDCTDKLGRLFLETAPLLTIPNPTTKGESNAA